MPSYSASWPLSLAERRSSPDFDEVGACGPRRLAGKAGDRRSAKPGHLACRCDPFVSVITRRHRGGGRTALARWAWLFAVAFVLNALWEVAQLPLYRDAHGIPACLGAATGDAAIILACLALATSAATDRVSWPLLTTLLATVAIGIELGALAAGGWAYSSAMPTLAGIGLAPLAQLPILGSLTVIAARRRRGKPGFTSRA